MAPLRALLPTARTTPTSKAAPSPPMPGRGTIALAVDPGDLIALAYAYVKSVANSSELAYMTFPFEQAAKLLHEPANYWKWIAEAANRTVNQSSVPGRNAYGTAARMLLAALEDPRVAAMTR